jgi:hypothetical protein
MVPSHRAKAQAEASRGQSQLTLILGSDTSCVDAETVKGFDRLDTSCRPEFVSIQA